MSGQEVSAHEEVVMKCLFRKEHVRVTMKWCYGSVDPWKHCLMEV